MANYNETTVAGSSYQRAWRVDIENGMTAKSLRFHEEKIVVLDDGTTINNRLGSVQENYDPTANGSTEFAVLNPLDGTDTGVTMTYNELYTALYSLYIKLATDRDNAAAAPEEPIEPI